MIWELFRLIFSTITIYAYGRFIPIQGFLQREVREMKCSV